MKPIRLIVKTKNQTYPIIIGTNLIKKIPTLLKKNSINFNQCLFVVDSKISKNIIKKITKPYNNKKIFIHYFKANEINKNQKNVEKIIDILLKKNFNRKDCLISIGGGITGDISGFAASLFKRGLDFINVPTTLLSQVDSSVGGKTGINTKYGKNLIGSFYQPRLVISDTTFLKTLPRRELICGYGEILKHSLITSKTFFNFLNTNVLNILNLKTPYIEKAIFQSCKIKKIIVEKDEKEKDLRKILNFGHTFAHAYEATLGYSKRLNHGEAVILGIKSALKFSFENHFIKKTDYQSIINHLNVANLPTNLNKFFSKKDIKKIIFFMMKDKKNNSDKINLILLKKIGYPYINSQYNKSFLYLFFKKELIN